MAAWDLQGTKGKNWPDHSGGICCLIEQEDEREDRAIERIELPFLRWGSSLWGEVEGFLWAF